MSGFDRVRNYFNDLSEYVKIHSQLSSVVGHRPSIGSNREDVITSVMKNHLPLDLEIVNGGVCLSHTGEVSRQIDIIIKLRNVFNMNQVNTSIHFNETIGVAIEVKSTLNKSTLFEALDNLRSIKSYNRGAIKFTQQLGENEDIFFNTYPQRYIWAYDSIDPTLLRSHLAEYEELNPDTRKLINGIYVNQKCIIQTWKKEKILTNGKAIPPETFSLGTLDSDKKGYGIASFFHNVMAYQDWSKVLQINLHEYINHAFFDN